MATDTLEHIDLDALIGPLDAEPEPKTLEECLQEAGGFPFVARTVSTLDSTQQQVGTWMIPVGTEWQFTGWHTSMPGMIGPEAYANGKWVTPTVRRWVLVGHRT